MIQHHKLMLNAYTTSVFVHLNFVLSPETFEWGNLVIRGLNKSFKTEIPSYESIAPFILLSIERSHRPLHNNAVISVASVKVSR